MKKGILFLGMVGAMVSGGAIAQQDSSRFYAGAGFGIVAVSDVEGISFSDANNGSIQFGYKISENFAIEAQYSKSTKDASASYTEENLDITELWWTSVKAMNPGMSMSEIQQVFPYSVADVAMSFEASIETTAIYGVYRSGGDLYFKAKAGYLSEKVKLTGMADSIDMYVEVANSDPIEFSADRGDDEFNELGFDAKQSVSEKDSGFSAGLGVGYKFTSHFFSELEYTMVDEDLDFYSVSVNYAF